jgi:hypothetical protein
LLEFRWPWRPYQQRVLDALEEHLADQKLHVVAAPGSGKTCLGLEGFRRLGEPGLVLRIMGAPPFAESRGTSGPARPRTLMRASYH